MDRDGLAQQIRDSIDTKERLLASCVAEIEALCELADDCLAGGGTLMFCGNGGSSCGAAHAAGELVGWFEDRGRDGIAALALGHEVPTLTAIGNDAGYDEVFARQVQAIGRRGDLVVGISTSGGSRNVVRALEVARSRGMRTAALASEREGPVVEAAEVAVRVPSTSTPRIQESHLLVVHLLCAYLEPRHAMRTGP